MSHPSLRDLATLKLSGSNWYKVGQKLKIPDIELEKIQRGHANLRRREDKHRICQRGMFGYWLRKSPHPHVQDVIHALKESGEERAAEVLSQKFSESHIIASSY